MVQSSPLHTILAQVSSQVELATKYDTDLTYLWIGLGGLVLIVLIVVLICCCCKGKDGEGEKMMEEEKKEDDMMDKMDEEMAPMMEAMD